MATLSTNNDTITAAVNTTRAVIQTHLADNTLPTSYGGGGTPPLPVWGNMDDSNLKKLLPGSWLLTRAGETRYVPTVGAIKEHTGGWQFTSKSQDGLQGAYMSKTTAQNSVLTSAILGVATDGTSTGANADKLLTADGVPAVLAFAESPPEAAPLVNLKIGNRASQTVAIHEALSILNLTWGSVQPPSVEALPSRGIIEATMIPWDMLEEADHPGAVRSTLSQLLIDISGKSISAYTIASLLAGLADQQFSTRSIRKIGAAIAAAARSTTNARPAARRTTRRSSSSSSSPSPQQLEQIKKGKSLLAEVRRFCDALTNEQLALLKSAVEEAGWNAGFPASAGAVGATASSFWKQHAQGSSAATGSDAPHADASPPSIDASTTLDEVMIVAASVLDGDGTFSTQQPSEAEAANGAISNTCQEDQAEQAPSASPAQLAEQLAAEAGASEHARAAARTATQHNADRPPSRGSQEGGASAHGGAQADQAEQLQQQAARPPPAQPAEQRAAEPDASEHARAATRTAARRGAGTPPANEHGGEQDDAIYQAGQRQAERAPSAASSRRAARQTVWAPAIEPGSASPRAHTRPNTAAARPALEPAPACEESTTRARRERRKAATGATGGGPPPVVLGVEIVDLQTPESTSPVVGSPVLRQAPSGQDYLPNPSRLPDIAGSTGSIASLAASPHAPGASPPAGAQQTTSVRSREQAAQAAAEQVIPAAARPPRTLTVCDAGLRGSEPTRKRADRRRSHRR